MLFSSGKILLGQRHVDPKKASSALHGEGTWTMPGGKLDFGETFVEGAVRELLEETGIDVNIEDMALISLTDNILPDVHFVTAGFYCDKFKGVASVLEPDEITRWEWFDIENLPKPLYPASAEVIEHYKSKIIYK
jgi:8-oxo-dGTP pyrophosphatase MutT (NUDIX family)